MFAPDEGAKQSQEEVIGEELNADTAESCSDKERKMSGFSESETGGLGGIQSGELAIQLSHQRPCLPPTWNALRLRLDVRPRSPAALERALVSCPLQPSNSA